MNSVKQHEAIIAKISHKFGGAGKHGRNQSSVNVMTFCFNYYKALLSLLAKLPQLVEVNWNDKPPIA